MSTKIFKPTFLYIKQHSVTGLLYFGKTTKSPEKYYGSGKYWKRMIEKYGRENVVNLWYCLFYDADECEEFAINFSKEYDIVNSPDWANLIPETSKEGGSTPKEGNGAYGKKQTQEHIASRNTKEAIEKRTISMKETLRLNPREILPEQREKISTTLKEKYTSEEIINPMSGKTGELHHYFGKSRPEHSEIMTGMLVGEKNGMYGKSHKEETKQKWIDNDRNVGEKNGMYGKTGELNHNYGKPRPPEVLQKMKETRERNNKPTKTIECPHCGKIGAVGLMRRWHFENCKLLNCSEVLLLSQDQTQIREP